METAPARHLGGIHHVTAIAGHPQENVDFYMGLLGMRLVKRSVNQDDPQTYHLFYADAVGSPGTDLTFFAWPGGPVGRRGAGQAITVALAIPPAAVAFWTRRLTEAGVPVEGPTQSGAEEVLAFADPHGLALELVAGPDTGERGPWVPWTAGPVPVEHAIRGIHRVTLAVDRLEPTRAFLESPLRFRLLDESGGRLRFAVGQGGSGAQVDVVRAAGWGGIAVGTVHHVAWRTPDDAAHQAWQRELRGLGAGVTPIIDRFWFRSIYFREPGGVLFEIATDGPGFAVDEAVERLGERLVLPPWLEPDREQIEQALLPIRLSVPAPGRT